MKPTRTLVAAALMALSLAGTAHAATQTLDGAGFSITFEEDLGNLFGGPSLSANTLSFSSLASFFDRSTASGAVSETFGFSFSLDPGYVLTSLGFNQSGTFSLNGGSSRVSAQSFVELDSGNGAAQGLNFAGGLNGNAGNGAGTGNWSATGGFSGAGITSANVFLSTALDAWVQGAGNKSFSSIALGSTAFTFSVAPVPEPEAYLMLLTGLGLVGFAARRRARQR